MIIKSFELLKIDLKTSHLFLLYGQNEGHKKEVIEDVFKKFYTDNVYTYDESEILQNEEKFFSNRFTNLPSEEIQLVLRHSLTNFFS